VPHGIAPRRIRSRSRFQTLQRKPLRRLEIAHAVLVMNRERFGRLAAHVRRTSRHVEQIAPAVGRFAEATAATRQDRQRAQRLGPNRVR
jgi:hypothetical protein